MDNKKKFLSAQVSLHLTELHHPPIAIAIIIWEKSGNLQPHQQLHKLRNHQVQNPINVSNSQTSLSMNMKKRRLYMKKAASI